MWGVTGLDDDYIAKMEDVLEISRAADIRDWSSYTIVVELLAQGGVRCTDEVFSRQPLVLCR